MSFRNCLSTSIRAEELIGKKATEACEELIRAHQWISKVRICHYNAPPSLQQRIEMGRIEEELVNAALKIRKDVGTPFWEALFTACLKQHRFTDPLLDAALLHQGTGSQSEISREDLLEGKLAEMVHQTGYGEAVGLVSEVELKSGKHQHFIFLDFHCEVSEDNTELVSAVSNRLLPGGYLLLDSGDSYHAWGIQLVSSSERVKLLGRSLFFMPIVDGIYIAHQLNQEVSSIRISVGGQRRCAPQVIAVRVGEG